MIRNEDGLLTGYIYVDLADREPEGLIRKPTRRCTATSHYPPGPRWHGARSSRRCGASKARLAVVIPMTLVLTVLLLWLQHSIRW